MATTTLWPSTFSSFTNVSQTITSTSSGCAPCASAQLFDLWRGSWSQNTSLPAVRTLQPYLDPVHNTTSTSTICNTAVTTAYDMCDELRVDDDCNLVCADWFGRPTTEKPYLVTVTGTTGDYMLFASTFRIEGGVSTTDSNGASTCLTSFDATLPETSYTYAGPTSVTSVGMHLVIMYELTDSYPGEGLFEQCTLFQTGPPPVALTPANQIVLPMLTLSGAATTTAQSPTTSPSSPTTTPRPADTGAGTTPTRTSAAQTTATDSPNPPEESDEPANPPPQTVTPEEPENEPTTSNRPSPSATTPEEPDDEPAQTTTQGSAPSPTQSDRPDDQDNEPPRTTTQGSGNPPVQSDGPGGQDDAPPATATQGSARPPAQSDSSPSIIVPSQSDDNASNTGAQPQNTGVSTRSQSGSGVPINPATTAAAATTSTDPIAIIPGVTFINAGSSSEIVIGGSTTIVAGGGVAVGSGTTFSVLPSAGGIEAVADGRTSTLPLPAPVTGAPATNTAPIAIAPGVTFQNDGSSQGVVVGGSTTIVAGGAAAVGSGGTTFSVLPSSGGVVAVADGSTRTLAVPTPAASAEQGNVRPLITSTQGVALPGATITGGGSIVTVSGTTFSALPSGLGVVVKSDGGPTTTVQASQLASLGISTVSGSPEAYILPSQTLAAGGAAAVISGATYSVLPQGNSIQIVSNGQTSVVAISEATGIPGVGAISTVDTIAEGYVLDGSITLIAGGAAATVSGVVYSALPSGLGVMVDGSDEFATYIEQGISGSGTGDSPYIIGGTALPSAGGDAVTVSGVVYSALPSGSGVLVVDDGKSTTIGLSSTTSGSSTRQSSATTTGDRSTGRPDATVTSGPSGDDAEESSASSTDAASSAASHLTTLSGCVFAAAMALLAML
ncbi:hypothetical protein MBLNU13_g10448t1 [Cladosporium sp. NU13]